MGVECIGHVSIVNEHLIILLNCCYIPIHFPFTVAVESRIS